MHVEGDKILSLQSGNANFSDNYWVVIPNGTSSSLGFHSWGNGMRISNSFTLEYEDLCNLHEAIGIALEECGNGMRISNSFTLEYEDLCNLHEAIGIALEECGHAVSRKSRGDKDTGWLSDQH